MNALKPAKVPDMDQKQSGLTLIELITVVIIFGIVATMAAPSFARLIAESRATSHANQFLGALIYARSEAIKTNNTVRLETNDDWQQGWTIRDVDNELLREQAALSGPVSLVCENNDCKTVVFTGAGHAQQAYSFTLCDNAGIGREIEVRSSGQPLITGDEPACS